MQGQKWKKNALRIEIDYLVQQNGTWINDKRSEQPTDRLKLVFLKASRESDFTFLPIRFSF